MDHIDRAMREEMARRASFNALSYRTPDEHEVIRWDYGLYAGALALSGLVVYLGFFYVNPETKFIRALNAVPGNPGKNLIVLYNNEEPDPDTGTLLSDSGAIALVGQDVFDLGKKAGVTSWYKKP